MKKTLNSFEKKITALEKQMDPGVTGAEWWRYQVLMLATLPTEFGKAIREKEETLCRELSFEEKEEMFIVFNEEMLEKEKNDPDTFRYSVFRPIRKEDYIRKTDVVLRRNHL